MNRNFVFIILAAFAFTLLSSSCFFRPRSHRRGYVCHRDNRGRKVCKRHAKRHHKKHRRR
ncbi:hypothetical protein KKF84_03350 [Myxococcota bacterium]|nr:hypothetical protein [Myxococcota bacterium]MBU1534327.1 hypothetical protein [Myxococcota bacterium]